MNFISLEAETELELISLGTEAPQKEFSDVPYTNEASHHNENFFSQGGAVVKRRNWNRRKNVC